MNNVQLEALRKEFCRGCASDCRVHGRYTLMPVEGSQCVPINYNPGRVSLSGSPSVKAHQEAANRVVGGIGDVKGAVYTDGRDN